MTDGLRTIIDKDAQPGEDTVNDAYKQHIKTLK